MATKADWSQIEVNPIPARGYQDRQNPHVVKRRIVELYAQFQGVSAIQKAIKDEFGVDLDKRTILHYDAGNPKARIGRRLKALYAEAREAYVKETARIGVANQAHRLRLIERVIEKATTSKDYNSALKGLELAAKEMGGVLEGKHTIRHEGSIEHRHLSVEDAKAELVTRLSHLIEGGTLIAHDPAPTEGSEPVATEGEG